MKIDTLIRHTREAFRSLRRNTWMAFAAVSAVGVTLLIFGFFLVFAFNLSYLASELDKQVAIRAFLDMTADDSNVEQIAAQIEESPDVKKVKIIWKDDGLRQMKESWGEENKFLEGLDEDNPLPDTLEIQAKDPQKTEQLAAAIKEYNQITYVNYGEGVSNHILNLSAWVRNAVFIFGLGLAVLAAFLISNTIKLTIFARKREIEVMRLVGASNWFIRWPFLIEGGLIGVMGATIPVAVTLISYNSIVITLGANKTSGFIKLLPMWPLSLYVAGITIMLGIMIGVWGSSISIRRFLKV